MRALSFVLSAPLDDAPLGSMDAWWARHREVITGTGSTLEQAILGGFAADRLGYAFASGYQAALRAICPSLPPDKIASLSVTERGGAHPQKTETLLSPAPEGYRLRGHKRWTSVADPRGVLLVSAADGRVDERGRKRIKLVWVDAGLPGVKITPMPETPFIPEIPHGEVHLDDVAIAASSILEGDGYERYVKPFRTVEDLHVQAALFGYLIAEARRNEMPHALIEKLAAMLPLLGGLAGHEWDDPGLHVALSGALRFGAAVFTEMEMLWARTESPAHARWERDRLLLSVAEGAREQRLIRAWERLGEAVVIAR